MFAIKKYLVSSLSSIGLVYCCSTAYAQDIPNLTDGFVRVDLEGSGGFDYLTDYIEPAKLTPEAQQIVANLPGRQLGFDYLRESETPKGEGEAYIVTSGVCNYRANTLLQPDSSAFFLTQTERMVILTREEAGVRHIYMDGRAHPELSGFTPDQLGHSIGWYEDGDLVVETVGLTPGGVIAGGYRTPNTVLTERYSLSDDDNRLTVNYTWTDPAIYVEPHSYEVFYERLPSEYAYAYESWCDSGDPLNRTSIIVPEQL